jgi:hypothetical protein
MRYWLMKIAAFGGGEVSVGLRLPEAFGDEVDNALFGLSAGGSLRHQSVAVKAKTRQAF